MGCRQAHLNCRIETDLAFDLALGKEAGIVLITDERHCYELGVADAQPVDGTDHRLGIDATVGMYRFNTGPTMG